MKTCIKHLFLLPALIAALGLITASPVTAQTFTTLYSFTGGSDGYGPCAGVVLSGNTLFGTTLNFPAGGTVFKVNVDGTGFTTLYTFTGGSDGATPYGGVVLSGNTLYGTTCYGGSSGNGTVFAVNTDGTGFTNLYSFSYGAYNPSIKKMTNSDGSGSEAGLILSGDTLYGTAWHGGSSDSGTVFKLNTNGTGFTTLYSFTGGSDGAHPGAGLILSGNTLYGTAEYGGSSGYGTVFAVNTNGTSFTNLYSFTATSNYTNSDGADPFGSLILSGNTLYGEATGGGDWGYGMVFAVNTNGTGFTTLYSLNGFISDGACPDGGLILSGNTLYGTALDGGDWDYGSVFSLSLPLPQLAIILSGANVILTWTNTVAGFTLQSTTNLGSQAVWTTVSPASVVVNGQNTVTNSISGRQQFYRLSQ